MLRRPIFGFGWGGWVAGLILVALCCARANGIDLRYELMRGLLEVTSIGAVYWVASVGLPAHHFAASDPMFSLATMALILPVLHRLPKRGLGWRAAIVTVWGVLGPLLWFLNYAGRLPIPLYGGSGAVTAAVNHAAITGLVLWVAMGGLPTALISVAASGLLWTMYLGEVPIPVPSLEYFVYSIAWHAVVIGAAWVECWNRRRRLPGPTDCAVCGYDLTGLAGQCPECGRAREAAAA